MNVFAFHRDPIIASSMLTDIHLNKMIIESTQLLSNGLHSKNLPAPYKFVFPHHPCTKWISESKQNYIWLLRYATAALLEYRRRFNKTHGCTDKVVKCRTVFAENIRLFDDKMLHFITVMPEEYRMPDPHESYIRYYRELKVPRLKEINRFKCTNKTVPKIFNI